ncbi:MAG: V-type ATP synthase subunit E [Ruminococcus sp.]|nr:V-type ATP synthase subunit E [Ruminococcus sp.]
MNGGEMILNRIQADSDKAVAEIRRKAEEARAAVLADADRQAQALEKEIADKTEQQAKQLRLASKSRCELEMRNALLRQRRAEIDKTVSGLLDYLLTLPDNAYFDALYRLAAQLKGKSGEVLLNQKDLQRKPQNFESKLREAGLDATVSGKPADILGGFVLKSGDIEENMDFSALINARRDQIEDLINRELFEQ